MTINLKKINIFISTLNFALFFVGYQLATSLFLPVSSDIEGISRTVTVPYRAFALFISMTVILLNIKKKTRNLDLAVIVYLVYWVLLLIRIFYDTNIRNDVNLYDTSQLWLYIFGIVLPGSFSVIKSYTLIDLEKALKWIFLGTVLTMILSLFNNITLLADASEITNRADGNLALNTISFGHLGTTGVILALYILFKSSTSLIKKIGLILILILSFFLMVRAGSRSPVLALATVLLIWLFAHGKNVIFGYVAVILALISIFLFIDPILSFLGNISPLMEYRLRIAIFEGNSSDRDLIFKEAFNEFLYNPILGTKFALFDGTGGFYYSHNIFLDALMGLGIFGGIAMAYILINSVKNIFYFIKNKDPHFWVGLILLQQIVLSMLSGAIYYNQILNALLVFILLYTKRGITVNTSNIENYEKKE